MVTYGFLSPKDTDIAIEGFEPSRGWLFFFQCFFHGDLSMETINDPDIVNRFTIGVEKAAPLKLSRSGLFHPHLFCLAGGHWIASGELVRALPESPGIQYMEVDFYHAYALAFPSSPEDLEIYIDLDEEIRLEDLPHREDLVDSLRDYRELFIPTFRNVFPEMVESSPEERQLRLSSYHAAREYAASKFDIPSKLRTFPLIDSYGGLIMTTRTLSRIEHLIDWRFFDFFPYGDD